MRRKRPGSGNIASSIHHLTFHNHCECLTVVERSAYCLALAVLVLFIPREDKTK